jgi:hypothetical protein
MRYQPLYGFRRTKAPRELPEPPLADAWFSYRLDTANLVAGTYTLRVAVLADDRCSYAAAKLVDVDLTDPR